MHVEAATPPLRYRAGAPRHRDPAHGLRGLAKGRQLQEDFAIMLPRLISLERDTDGLALRGTIREIEAPIVLRAFDERALSRTRRRGGRCRACKGQPWHKSQPSAVR